METRRQPVPPSELYSGAGLPAEQLACDSVWFAHAIIRGESTDHKNKSEAALNEMGKIFSRPQLVQKVSLIDGTQLQTWKMMLSTHTSEKPVLNTHEQIR